MHTLYTRHVYWRVGHLHVHLKHHPKVLNMVFPLAWPRGVVPVLKIDHPKIWETEKREERREGRREKKKEAVSLWCIPIHEKVSWNSTLTEELMGEKFKDDGLNAERVYTLFRERIFLWKMLLRRRIFSVSKSRTIVSFFSSSSFLLDDERERRPV